VCESTNTNRDNPVVLLALAVLFLGSGCAALIYEIVWFQLLQQVIGSSVVSLGVLLGTFMAGMCAGSLALPHLISRSRHPLRVFAVIELCLGMLGVAVLIGLPYLQQLYLTGVMRGFPGLLWRGLLCALCLLPPTFLMGATLPAIARWVESTPRGVSWLGYFYAANLVGAVTGCLLAGFYLLRVHDVVVATCVAVIINTGVGIMSFSMANFVAYCGGVQPTRPVKRQQPCGQVVYLVIAISGLCALGAEVVWTRLLSLTLGGTVYTFAIILAMFLIGLGIGSGAGALLARRIARPRRALGVCQLLVVAAVFLAAVGIAKGVPGWSVDVRASSGPWIKFLTDMMRCGVAVIPAALLWGMSFPMALAAVVERGRDPGRLVGQVYAANTIGAIIGALGVSLLVIGWMGTQNAQRLLMGLALVAAGIMYVSFLRSDERRMPGREGGPWSERATQAIGCGVVALALMMIWAVPELPASLVTYGRHRQGLPEPDTMHLTEGVTTSVAVSRASNGARHLHVNGKVVVSTEPYDMRLVRMLAHLPGLLHPEPKSALVVGCGAGVTAGALLEFPSMERIVICEIEPVIPDVASRFFADANRSVLEDPRVEVVHDDARHYISTTQEHFDIITSDPIHPWMKGVASLYTREYFELVQAHLNPGGMVTQWVPLYESDAAVVKSELATFFNVFPSGTVWGSESAGKGHDLILLGTGSPLTVELSRLDTTLGDERFHSVATSMNQVGFESAHDLISTYAGQAADMQGWLDDAVVNRDHNLRLQYLAGLTLDLQQGDRIYREILSRRRDPSWLMVETVQ
jgi:spermidine synthase